MRFPLALAAVLALSGMAAPASAAQLLVNGSFESPNIGTGAYTYPAGGLGGWTYSGSALVNGSGGSAWYGSTAPAGMDGVQFAALQATSSLSQSFTADASTLHLSWLDAGRTWGMGDQSYQILLDGGAVGGTFGTASDDAFGFNTLSFTGLNVGQVYNLAFKGLATSDETAFIDKVQLSSVAPTPPPAPPLITLSSLDLPLPVGQDMIEDFDNPIAPGFSFTQNQNAFVRSGSLGLWGGVSAPPPGTTSNYETVMANGRATLAALTPLNRLTSFSFYMGSPDTYNSVRFIGDNGYDFTLAGAAIWGSNTGANGNQGWGRRVSYDFGSARVHTIEFLSSGNSFEFDNLAGATANMGTAVPEPATWAMMILGFGAVGHLIRRRRVFAAIG